MPRDLDSTVTYQWLYSQLAHESTTLETLSRWAQDYTGCSAFQAVDHVGERLRAAEDEGALLFVRGRWVLTQRGREALSRMVKEASHAA